MIPSRLTVCCLLVPLLLAASPMVGAPAAQGPEVKIVTPEPDEPPADPIVVQALVRPGSSPILRVDAWLEETHLGALHGPPYRWVVPRPAGATTIAIRVVALDEGNRKGQAERVVSTLDAPVFRGETTAVTLNLAALDAEGRPVDDLRAEEVRLLDRGRPQELLRFARDEAPLRVALLVDQSGSMAAKMEQTRLAVAAFLDELGPDDLVRLMGFNHRVVPYTPFTTRHGMVATFARGIVPYGSTALFDALLYGLRQVEAAEPGPERRAIFLFTDGEDLSSRNPRGRVAATVRDAGVTLFVLGQGEALADRGLRDELQGLADATGGRAFFAEDPAGLPGIFAEIGRRMRALYFLSYRPTDPSPGWHELRVEVDRAGIQVRHRQGYRSAGP